MSHSLPVAVASANNISFANLSYRVPLAKSLGGPSGRESGEKNAKTVLSSISGCFRAGELTAIMGPSGAGKSSLLNILTGFTKNGITGSIRMHNTAHTSRNYGKQCSYIQQEDKLYGNFTVQETMWLAARLKIANISDDRRRKLIDGVLDTLQLLNLKRSTCRHISGGQRKRLSIALELLDNRAILVLDEPTSGLDSLSAAYCVRLLRNLALQGRTVVLTIHQPDARIYEMLDQVYVLANGECLYQGQALNTVAFLASNGLQCPVYHNAADFIIEVAAGEYGDHSRSLVVAAKDSRWMKSVQTRDDVDQRRQALCESVYAEPSEWTKCGVLMGRIRSHFFRDWTYTYLRWFMHLVCASIFGALFGDTGSNASKSLSNLGLLCSANIYMWFNSMFQSVLKFPTDIEIVKKETYNGWYKVHTYFFAQMIVTVPIQLASGIGFGTIVFLMTNQPADSDRFVRFILVFMLLVLAGDGLGLVIGAVLDPVNGVFVGCMIATFNIAMGGFLAMPSQMSLVIRKFMEFTTLKHAMEATMLSLYDNDRPNIECPGHVVYCHYVSPEEVVKMIGYDMQNYTVNVAVLFGQVIMLNLLAFGVIRARIKGYNFSAFRLV